MDQNIALSTPSFIAETGDLMSSSKNSGLCDGIILTDSTKLISQNASDAKGLSIAPWLALFSVLNDCRSGGAEFLDVSL